MPLASSCTLSARVADADAGTGQLAMLYRARDGILSYRPEPGRCSARRCPASCARGLSRGRIDHGCLVASFIFSVILGKIANAARKERQHKQEVSEAAARWAEKREVWPVGRIPNAHLLLRLKGVEADRVSIKILDEFALTFDSQVGAGVDELNAIGLKRDPDAEMVRQYYTSGLFRPVRPVSHTEGGVQLEVAPMRHAHFAILTTTGVSHQAQEHVRAQIEEVAGRVRPERRSEQGFLNWRNYHPLGIKVVVVTGDDQTLLRRCGTPTAVSGPNWDVPLGGHCGEADRIGAEVDIGQWAKRELIAAIGIVPCDPDTLLLTGLHRNKATGSLDLLGFWRIEATAADLRKVLARGERGRNGKKCDDLCVEFDWSEICKALGKTQMYTSPDAFAPEALVSLLLALEIDGKQVPEWDATTAATLR
jgi:hypothetical protein